MAWGRRLRGYIELSRPINGIAAGLLTVVGAFVAGGAFTAPRPTLVAGIATFLATAAGNAINDYFDRDVDRINAPERPIPSGAVSPLGARTFSGILFVIGALLVFTLPDLAVIIGVINFVLLIVYTPTLKGLPGVGNAAIAYLGGSTFLFGGAAVGDVGAAGILFVLAAFATFTREAIKDVEDMDGDESAGLATLPLLVGRRRTLTLGAIVLIIAVAASPLPYLEGTFGLAYLALVVPADLIMLYAVAASFRNPTRGQTYLKYGMFVAIVSFLVGRLAG